MAKRIHRELLRAHVLLTTTQADQTPEAPGPASANPSSEKELQQPPTSTHQALHRALTHTQLALVLAQHGHRLETTRNPPPPQQQQDNVAVGGPAPVPAVVVHETQDNLHQRALLTQASLLRRLGLRRQGAVMEIEAAARVEGLVVAAGFDDGRDGGEEGEEVILVGGVELEKVVELWDEQ